MKANTIGHMMRRNWLLWHVTEGKKEGRLEATASRERILKQLLDDIKENKIQETERSSTSHCLENSLWKRLWTFRKTDCIMNELPHGRYFLKIFSEATQVFGGVLLHRFRWTTGNEIPYFDCPLVEFPYPNLDINVTLLTFHKEWINF
jgi:hypothetical protein